MKIAIVGSGVSGLTCAHYLARRHEVVLFESDDRAGGHANTVNVREGERPIPIDTGFIVFNTRTYPGFVRLLGELGVAWAPSDMSMSARSEQRDFEYAGHSLSALFAQRRRLLDPRFHRMALDIVRFYREARELLDAGPEEPLLGWVTRRRYSRAFIEDHLLPLVRAVWSASRAGAEGFPARTFARFFDNHGFLRVQRSVQWLTIPGGARSYVRAILAGLRGQARIGDPVLSVRRTGDGAVVTSKLGGQQRFDHVVLACHSDTAHALLADPSPLESELLAAFPYQANQAVLHTDHTLMPRERRAWASWNVHLDGEASGGARLTYWMNRLQPLDAAREYFVTLNTGERIRPDRILGRFDYRHPVLTPAGIAAQARHASLVDHRCTSYVGAYWGNGFHEDGVASALRVCERLGVQP